jgi:hypothetical protein
MSSTKIEQEINTVKSRLRDTVALQRSYEAKAAEELSKLRSFRMTLEGLNRQLEEAKEIELLTSLRRVHWLRRSCLMSSDYSVVSVTPKQIRVRCISPHSRVELCTRDGMMISDPSNVIDIQKTFPEGLEK